MAWCLSAIADLSCISLIYIVAPLFNSFNQSYYAPLFNTQRHITEMKRKGNKMSPKLYNEMINRTTAATIVQLRTGHYTITSMIRPIDLYTASVEMVKRWWNIICQNARITKKLQEAIGTGKMKAGRNPTEVEHTMAYLKEKERFN